MEGLDIKRRKAHIAAGLHDYLDSDSLSITCKNLSTGNGCLLHAAPTWRTIHNQSALHVEDITLFK